MSIAIDLTRMITAETKADQARAALITSYRAAVDAHVESAAQARGYNGAAACASYVASTNPAWAAEAAAYVAWRDMVWGDVLALLAVAEAGGDVPSLAEMMDRLPVIAWP